MELLVPPRNMKIFAPVKHYKPKHKEDNVSSDYKMIYHNSMGRYYEYLFPITVVGTAPIIVMDMMFAYQYFIEHKDIDSDAGFNKAFTMADPELFICVATIFMVGLLYAMRRVTQLYIPRIYYNSEKDHYIGIIKKRLFGNTQFHFTIKDVQPIPKSTRPIVIPGNIVIKGRTFLVNGKDFAELDYYNRLRGHVLDKPLEDDMPNDDLIKMLKSQQRDRTNNSKRAQRK